MPTHKSSNYKLSGRTCNKYNLKCIINNLIFSHTREDY